MKKLYSIILLLFCLAILILSVRGLPGNPSIENLLTADWRAEGPFELSPERGRFALTYSIIEEDAIHFSSNLARFVLPDVGYREGKYVSLFAPALSFIIVPGYLLGQTFGMAQVGSFFTITLFALLNTVLLRKVGVLMGAKDRAADLAALVFLFATPAFAYAVNLYQHHVTTTLVLLCIYLTIKKQNLLGYTLIFFLFALGVTLDYPNFFLLAPFLIHQVFTKFFLIKEKRSSVTMKFNLKLLASIFGILLPLGFFFWFNNASYGSPFNMLGGSSVEAVGYIDEEGLPALPPDLEDLNLKVEEMHSETGASSYFLARNMVNGLYTHLISSDRGILYFTPVILTGVLGIWVLYKEKNKYLPLLLSVVGVNLTLYSMWGDPWGGWAFGSRYLIPSYAIMSIFLAQALTKYSRNLIFLLAFFVLFVYSTGINTLGAITTSAIPPKVQAIPLEALTGREEKYNFKRSWDYLHQNGSKSYFYQEYLEGTVEAKDFYFTLVSAISGVGVISLVGVYLIDHRKNDGNKN